ncbi:FkbM family methyltransferase [Sulfitobacter aestuariivivens]|uniref:FkbM family methyltransferase n=1 Tax=Sulfitobacter aestuariivivens TaxID=2766981 RepID=A0A927D0Q9_9RHOB|nr:FkbM family methyltransferase [Sulfitobacter aestuariivivens]MBD3662884.1 FkbM family methyltransferase [Sulfitobacter aestuariivivens]
MENASRVAAECHGVKVPDSPMITPERAARINAARYEGQEIAGALDVIRPGDHVLELGAGIGLVGAIAAKKARPAKVLSFEANPGLIQHINALYALNDLQHIIEVRNEVLISAPDAPEYLPFHIRNSYLGSSLIDSDKRATTRVEVPTAAYEDVREGFAPTVLLMDIEGGELDFLRHANLDGIRAIVIEFHPEAYGKDGMRTCKAILERAGFAKVPAHCTRHVWTCTFDAEVQPPQPDAGWAVETSTLENALIVPPTEQKFVQPAGVLRADGKYHAAGALWRNGRALTIAPDPPANATATREGTWLWGGVLWMHFGHFLVESTSRLWALNTLQDQIDGVLFVPKRPRNGTEVHEFQKEFISLLAPDMPVECIAEPTKVERLIVPGQGFGLGKMIAGTDAFRAAITADFATDIAPDGPEKLYISRSGLPAGRGNLIGETELEAHLSAQGYAIYHPQNHSLTNQIATYKAAKHIIAAEGSALHLLAMVARPTQHVAIIVRRPSGATRNLEQHLQSFAGITPVTLSQLTRSWKPLGAAKPRLWKGELDMPALQQDLIAAGFIGASKTTWDPLDPSDVQSRLGDKFEEVA